MTLAFFYCIKSERKRRKGSREITAGWGRGRKNRSWAVREKKRGRAAGSTE